MEEDKPKDFRDKWHENIGRIARMTPEEKTAMARKAGLASAAAFKAKKELERKLKDKEGMLREATAAVMLDDPEVIEKIMGALAKKAMNPEDKGQMAAADLFLKHSGITAPKQTEAVVESKQSQDEVMKELEQLGVSVEGFKVVNGGKS